MMRFIFLVVFACFGFLWVGLWGCDSRPATEGKTPVSLTLNIPALRQTNGLRSAANVPPGVASIALTVSGVGMDPVDDRFDVVFGEPVTRFFLIPSGPDRVFNATAYLEQGAIGDVVFKGQSELLTLKAMVPTTVNLKVQRTLSPEQGVVGDTIKIFGSGFGISQGTNTVNIGGVEATATLRWSDGEIAVEIPPGVAVSQTGSLNTVEVKVNGVSTRFGAVRLFNHILGVSGELGDGNLNKIELGISPPTLTVTFAPLTSFLAVGETSSIVLSGDGTVAVEADVSGYGFNERLLGFNTASPTLDNPVSLGSLDVALSRDGSTAVFADGGSDLALFTSFNTTPVQTLLVGPKGVGFFEVAVSSGGSTAAAVGSDLNCSAACFVYIYRIDHVLSRPMFTQVTAEPAASVAYTDVAMSEDGNTVLVGRIATASGTSSVELLRILDFSDSQPQPQTGPTLPYSAAAGSSIWVDVDLSADGMTAIVGVSDDTKNLYSAYQILGVDAVSITTLAQIYGLSAVPIDGVAVNSGGSVALAKNTRDATLYRWDGFNQPKPVLSIWSNVTNLNQTTGNRRQDQIDLQ